MRSTAKQELYRRLPAVDELLRDPRILKLSQSEGRAPVTSATRNVIERLRHEIAAGRLDADGLELALAGISDEVAKQVRQSLQYSLRPLINATGVILHTNLGRAPLARRAVEHMAQVAAAYSNLELDIASGERGRRDAHADAFLARVFEKDGIEDIATIVVNNNAAAVLLALNTLAEGGEVIVSRGELVEIGGSFRIPDVMAKSGAVLREVGTTNRTRIQDYERAINERTRLLLRVHRSNFQIVGFTEQPPLEELINLAGMRKLAVMEDLGSGAIFDLASVGISGEPGVADSLRAGVDVVTYSGDKLLGGPQAGLLSGPPQMIGRIRSNPLFRALRVDKLTYAALEATLLSYIRGDHDAVPALRMMRLRADEIRRRAEVLKQAVEGRAPRLRMTIEASSSVIGGGAAPGAKLPTFVLAITCDRLSADELAARLRGSENAVIARVEDGRVMLDLRTVFPEQEQALAGALLKASA